MIGDGSGHWPAAVERGRQKNGGRRYPCHHCREEDKNASEL